VTTFPQHFQHAGYRTAMFGKWHMGVDMDPKPGFDHWACFQGQGTYFDPRLNVNGQVTSLQGFTDDVTSGLAAEWMTARDQRPFLAVVGFKSCHSPFEPPPRTASLYEGVRMPRPPSFDRPLPDQPQWIQQFDDAGHTPYSRIPFDELALRFARLVTAADENVGRMMSALEAADQLDRTLIIVSSDNGFLLHEHGLYDKRAMYEESIRVPLLMRHPGLVKRSVIDDLTLNVDLAPTLLDIIGVRGAEQMQGCTLLPAMQGRRRTKRSIFFYQYDRETPYSTPSLMGVRTPEWKLVRYQEEGQLHELYNVKKDPFEMRNLFESKGTRRERERLERELARLAPLASVSRPIG
jgi:N-acetylglucosamine-6-sulfatase